MTSHPHPPLPSPSLQYGILSCTFYSQVPRGSVSASPYVWTTAGATLNLPGGATCSTPSFVPITHPVYATGSTGTGSTMGSSGVGATNPTGNRKLKMIE